MGIIKVHFASAILYAAPADDPGQCQWESRPALNAEPPDDRNSALESDPLAPIKILKNFVTLT